MKLDIKIQQNKTRSGDLFNPPDSSNYIYINKYKYKNYYLYYKYTNKYNFSIELKTINDRINYNFCCLFDTQKYRIEFINTGDNCIDKFIIMGNNYYRYLYSGTYELNQNIFNAYLLYKYLLSLEYITKINNMKKNISKVKKFNCMQNYKIIIYIVAAQRKRRRHYN